MENFFVNSSQPYIIAGPCAIENDSQFSSAVDTLSQMPQVAMIRCGIWKPRTRPGGFEGLGEKAFAIVERQRGRYPRLRFCCEVASPAHLEAALAHGMDAIWVGARTTASPFAIQELSEALRGTDIQLLVKNAPSPDIRLWLGAIERFRQVGVTSIAAVHRGFDIYNNLGYRNNPLWQLPIELHRLMPDLPIFCDPSHIAGRTDAIAQLSQTALDLHFDGLMLEVHPTPSEALTDAAQQLTPVELTQLLSSLVCRTENTDQIPANLQELRTQIDLLDHQLLQLLADRLQISCQIAQVKQQHNLSAYQPKRWQTLLDDRLAQASGMGLDQHFVKTLLEMIHAESVARQEELLNNKD